ncbi:MAG TPA: oxidoreductase, partial [Mycobacterium sp.]
MGLLPHDLLVTAADAVVSSTFWVSTRLRKPPVPEVVERTIRLRIADRQVVAHDQDVVALTFVSADGTELPRWHPGSHLDIHLPSGLV